MIDEEIYYSDYKEYETSGKMYSVGCINVYDEDAAREMSERMKKVVPSTLTTKGMDMAFAQINILHDNISMTFIVASDDTATNVIKSAFPNAAFDGTSFRFNPGISRKQVLIPAITNILETYAKE